MGRHLGRVVVPAPGRTRPRRADRVARASAVRFHAAALMALLLGFLVLTAGAPAAQQQAGGAPTAPAVTVARVEQRDVTPSTSFTGRIEAKDKVDLRARVEGFLERQLFAEGLQKVAPGHGGRCGRGSGRRGRRLRCRRRLAHGSGA